MASWEIRNLQGDTLIRLTIREKKSKEEERVKGEKEKVGWAGPEAREKKEKKKNREDESEDGYEGKDRGEGEVEEERFRLANYGRTLFLIYL